MKICRYTRADGSPGFGRLEGDWILELDEGQETGDTPALADVRLLPPVSRGRVFGIGRNYSEHIRELNPGWSQESPLVFMKPDTALCGHGHPILLPMGVGRVDYEGELAAVVGQPMRRVSASEALDGLLGLCIANDISARELQRSDGQWTRAKGFDTFCPLGPWIETELDPSDLGIRTWLNGQLVQEGRTSQMMRSLPDLIAFLSSFCLLLPGDVILTGTPAGVGALAPGDRVRVEVEGIGSLENPVESEHAD
ncbi:MAG: fumarylacetoacetate hydrolase family protein [Calditrichaeota bacterium]|nr:fumarylacetoacetate hydrolase family protein [Calditrichota bacterium]